MKRLINPLDNCYNRSLMMLPVLKTGIKLESMLLMNRMFALILLLCCAFSHAHGQIVAANDTIYRINLRDHEVESTRIWTNDTVRYHYNQKKYYVKTILPYLEEAVALFNELDAKLNDPALQGRERQEYIRSKEAVVRGRFEDKIKSMNQTQGVLLIKLAARQTGLNIYHQLADFKGVVSAMKWQAWARVHGFNLNRKYHPEDDPDLERIMIGLGYPLPVAHNGAHE